MISVVIPAYNASQCIERAIDSVLAQTFADYEIIVVDDGSTDNTAEIIRQYGDKVKYIRQDNAGVSVARNTAIAAAKGDWIAFLDADDEWLPEKLFLQMELVRRNPDLRWCASNYYQSDGRTSAPVANTEVVRKALAGRDYFENYFSSAAKGICRIITTVIMVHKTVFNDVGLFDPGLLRGQDVDLWWRIAHRHPRIGYIAEPLATLYLDVANVVLTKRRLATKRGQGTRKLVALHLRLAEEEGSLSEFKPYARKLLRKSLIATIYHGFKTDARITVKQFSSFFPWYWRIGTYLLTIFPVVTSAILRTIAYLAYVFRLQRQVTRRWLHRKNLRKNP